jgi:asparagine synthase (glutamine-hydrolysing)
MCGIAGVIKFREGSNLASDVLRRMCAAMVHRGPDDEGIYAEGRVGIGMRRLSIVDLATGHQPISNEDETIWIVFNGEIYNHAELRPGLKADGHRYRTQSDTETIIHLYEQYGRDCVKHLRGMFAFAIWDNTKRHLFIARDRLGIKPLYYYINSQELIFGSEIKVLLAYGIRPEFRRACVPEYLAFGYLSGAETFFSGIKKLMPGHWLEIDEQGNFQTEQYWDLDLSRARRERARADCVSKYREMLEQAVSSHLMSDVPLGVFLSGGVDSSAVAALMSKIRKEPVETFSVGYPEQSYSELPYARQVAKHLNSIHHEVLLSKQEFFDSLPQLIWHEDEPIAWPSSVSLYFVARLARESVTVVLTGEGSDETLAGYSRYGFTLRNAALNSLYSAVAPAALRKSIRNFIANSPLIGADLRRKLGHTFLGRDGKNWASFYFDNFFSAFSWNEQYEALTDEMRSELQSLSPYANVLSYWDHSSGDMLQRLLYTDIKTYLVELLMKQDNMSMAASIESRVPFLDHVLVEFAASIPRHIQFDGLAGKQVLKKAIEDLLPHSILYRPKLGFPTPWSGWLAGQQLEVIKGLLLDPRAVRRGLFKPSAVEKLIGEHRAGFRDHYDRIWRLLNLELWQRIYVDGEIPNRLTVEPAMARVTAD